jgi:UDP-N-acetylglucosamine acyltransferase
VIGGEPQDVSYRGEPTAVEIGDHNVFRESVTVNRGTVKDARVTRIGSHCYFMAGSHAAHDCQIGDHVILANAVLLGGHVHVHDFASLAGGAAVHHYTTIGKYAFVGGLSRVIQDVPPFMLAEGSPARPRYVNLVALKRNGFPTDIIAAIAEAYRLLYRASSGLDQTRQVLRERGKLLPQVNELLHFVQNQHEGRNGRARQLRRAA